MIRANNNYPFKTGEEYVWFIAIEDKEVVGFVPVEQKSRKKAVINNYYVKAEGTVREEILSHLLPAIVAEFRPESWLLNSVTLVQDLSQMVDTVIVETSGFGIFKDKERLVFQVSISH